MLMKLTASFLPSGLKKPLKKPPARAKSLFDTFFNLENNVIYVNEQNFS